jgi:hypothetical protein
MATVQFYTDDSEARLFDKELTITLNHPTRDLTLSDATKAFRSFGFKIESKWYQREWGWEAKFSSKSK